MRIWRRAKKGWWIAGWGLGWGGGGTGEVEEPIFWHSGGEPYVHFVSLLWVQVVAEQVPSGTFVFNTCIWSGICFLDGPWESVVSERLPATCFRWRKCLWAWIKNYRFWALPKGLWTEAIMKPTSLYALSLQENMNKFPHKQCRICDFSSEYSGPAGNQIRKCFSKSDLIFVP